MIPDNLLAQLAKATVPALRKARAQFDGGLVCTPSARITATVTIDGIESVFRVTFEVDPESDADDAPSGRLDEGESEGASEGVAP